MNNDRLCPIHGHFVGQPNCVYCAPSSGRSQPADLNKMFPQPTTRNWVVLIRTGSRQARRTHLLRVPAANESLAVLEAMRRVWDQSGVGPEEQTLISAECPEQRIH